MAKYSEILSKTKEELAKEQVSLAVANGKAAVQKEISDLTAKGTMLEIAYNSALGANPFNLAKVKALKAEKAENGADLEFANSILTELF